MWKRKLKKNDDGPDWVEEEEEEGGGGVKGKRVLKDCGRKRKRNDFDR